MILPYYTFSEVMSQNIYIYIYIFSTIWHSVGETLKSNVF